VSQTEHPLVWLEPGQTFPDIERAWGPASDAPGLLCAGGDLSVQTLKQAYSHGIFPWFSPEQPILWWNPDPRMVLTVSDFKLHPSLKKSLKKFAQSTACEIRVDGAFEDVITACAHSPRHGANGTWIVPTMVQAYVRLHHAGLAHSVETWVDGQLVGGLYFVSIGHAVFGESMFHRTTDASKIALAALIAMCRRFDVARIDCQQNTRHLASLGAAEVSRGSFAQQTRQAIREPVFAWKFSPIYWNDLLTLTSAIS